LTIEADVAVRAQRFGAEVETVAFYTIREALANIAKHADATSARITLALTPAGLRIDVTDDGFGFDPHTARAAPAEQTGLANIRDRVAAIDGRFHLESTPRVGTHLVVELPLAAQPEEPGPGEQPSAGAVTGPAVPSSDPARTEPARA
jgi:signal transduction histidine kinase